MIIAIDYDNTFTRDPDFWSRFVVSGRAADHTFVMVTGRVAAGLMGREVLEATRALALPVVFAGSQWKRDAARDRGWLPDVWIDDSPEYVGIQNALVGGERGR